MTRTVWKALFSMLSLGLVLLACTVDLESLAPFPCAEDLSCPAGLACNAEKKCVAIGYCAQTQCGAYCVDVRKDPSNCGSCGTKCASSGADACCPSSDESTGSCINLQTSDSNCGSCGNACGTGRECNAGECVCAAGKTECGNNCVDLKTDVKNCGACGKGCKSGASCVSGKCICPSNTTDCGDVCADLKTDEGHCGSCTTACKPGAECKAGGCACDTPKTDCPLVCTDLNTDKEHCGGCDTNCDAPGVDATCNKGTCARACTVGYVDCNGNLTDGCEGAAPGGGTCSFFPAKCGCPANQACTRASATSPETCVASSNLQLMQPCTTTGPGQAPCASGLICADSLCQATCRTSTDCGGKPGSKCVDVNYSGKPIPGLKFCNRSCNPLNPTLPDATHQGCAGGQGCLASPDGTTYCIGGASAGPGQTCGSSIQCTAAYVCVGSTSAGYTCKRHCRVGVAGDCGAGTTCTSFSTKQYDGTTQIGFCQ